MAGRPTTWVGLWLEAALLGDQVRADKLTTRLNSGSPRAGRSTIRPSFGPPSI